MQKTLNAMPNNNQDIKAQTILEINANHEIANKLKDLYKNDKDELKKYTQILYAQARLLEGLNIEYPTELSLLFNNRTQIEWKQIKEKFFII